MSSEWSRELRGGAVAPLRRVAGAPISWGVCEVPGWGRQLEPRRVFAEMASLGLHATELGPVGWVPLDASQIRATLEPFDLQLVAAFVPLVLHEPGAAPAREQAKAMAELLAAAGAEIFVAAIVADEQWSPPPPSLADDQWDHLTAHLRQG